jgi:alcohol dehydrogenase class IV
MSWRGCGTPPSPRSARARRRGTCRTGSGAAHALGYPVSTRHGLPHGLANALVLPAVVERLLPARKERYDELARLWDPALAPLGPGEAARYLPDRIRRWLAELGVEAGLGRHGVPEAALAALAREASGFGPVLANTPAELDAHELSELYRRSWPPEDRRRELTLADRRSS